MFDPVETDLSANQDTRDHEACHIGQVRWDTGRRHWLATRYADVKCVLTDPRFVCQAPASERGQDDSSPDVRVVALFRQMRQQQLHWMQMSSPSDHTRIRGEFGPFFSRERVDGLRPYIQARADELIDRVEPLGEMDLVEDYSDYLPFDVSCEVVGVPEEDRPQVKRWARETVHAMSVQLPLAVRSQGIFGMLSLTAYFRRLAKSRREQAGSDMISTLIVKRSLSDDELVANAALVLVGGLVNLRALIPVSMLILLRDPKTLSWFRHHSSRLGPALDELLRSTASVHLLRWAIADVELGGQMVRKGEAVLSCTGATNHDPAQFDAASSFDPTRAPNPHLAFAVGIHSCIGAGLARAELEIALATLLRRLPNLALRPGPIESDKLWSRGLKALRVSF